jgi:DNA end-binding protein Ku
MARSIWSGAISFGLVSVPVRLYSATEQKDVRFHEFDERSGKRIRHKRVAEGSNKEVDYDEISKGYEVSKGKYVVLSKEELEAADPEKTRTIDIEDFVELAEIDPIYFEKTYYLGPGKDAGSKRAYALLVEAMEDTGLVAISRFVMRSKEYLATVRPKDGVLLLDTMFFADEVRDAKDVLEESAARTKVEARDLKMAKQLIGSLATDFQPKKYKDEYRKRVLSVIKKKEQGKEIVVEEETRAETPPDLMEALRASVEAIGARKKTGTKASSAKRKTGTKRRKAS